MSLEINETCHGFKLKHKENIAELKSLALQFEHEKTGAQLIVMENDDDNKVFSITFRTPPENDRGVAHILEHSVLCGSKKYPVKEPFVELMKGSLQTFLNAMTFPDKTMYPVASRNLKDFYNLMNVYLDAVFFPKITEETFKQEGWHYELEEPGKPIVYKGVVFNEMKGVFSSPESVLDRHLAHSLFPKTTYGYESGGDPVAIPELTYEEFKNFHSKLYHPGNSRIFLYGDGPTEEYLKFLNENCLNSFSHSPVDSSIGYQRKFSKPKRKMIKYPVAKDESLDKKTFVVVGLKLSKAVDQEHCMAMSMLSHILMGTAASPLRKALIDSDLGMEVIGGGFDDNRAETIFAVGLKGTEADREEKIINLIFSTLEGLAENGIDKDTVKSSVNTIEFKLREANFGGFPKGIVYNIQALGSWLYDSDPLIHLRYDAVLKKIKRKSQNGYFEKLIRRYLLDNKHQSILVLEPKPGLAEKHEAKVRKKLRQVKSEMSEADLEKLVEETQTLQMNQTSPDSPEALATLPQLELSDVDRESKWFPIEVKKEKSPQILYHDLFTNKIAYTQMCFNTQAVPQDKIQYLSLLGRLVLGMGTNKRGYVEMSQQIGIHTGGISASHYATVTLADRDNIVSYINFNGKSLMAKMGDLFHLYAELFGEYTFANSKRLVEILRSTKSDIESSIVPYGNQYVLSRLQSYSSRLGKYDEITDGITYYTFIEKLLERAEKNPEQVAGEFQEVADMVFTQDNLLVNITSEEADYANFEKKIKSLNSVLPDRKLEPAELKFDSPKVNEAFATASTVQYVGKGANLYDLGYEFSGTFFALKSILRTGYLWDRVRVQGGAYGCTTSFDHFTGDFGLVSYRDPNLRETLQVFDEISDFLANLDLSKKELEKIIIGCVGQLDPPLTPDRKGAISRSEYMTGMTHDIKQKKRDELLATEMKDIRAYSDLFRKVKETGNVCVLGNEGKIQKAHSSFDHVVKIFN